VRVTNNILTNTVLRDLARNAEALLHRQEMLSSGRRIVHPSDDPLGLVAALDIESALDSLDQFGRNIDTAETFIGPAEEALRDSLDIFAQARALGLSMSSDMSTLEMRAVTAVEIDALLGEMVSLANRRVRDRYIFGGERTDQPPKM